MIKSTQRHFLIVAVAAGTVLDEREQMPEIRGSSDKVLVLFR